MVIVHRACSWIKKNAYSCQLSDCISKAFFLFKSHEGGDKIVVWLSAYIIFFFCS